MANYQDKERENLGNGPKDQRTKSKSTRKRGNSRPRRDDDRPTYKDRTGSKTVEFRPGNDFSWWNKYPEIMKDAVNMRSNWIPGTDALTARGVGVGVPGAAAFWMVDTYGWDGSTAGPLNIAARDLYLKMFQKYRGISSYQAADVGIVLVAGIEVMKTVAVLERIYGIINRYNKGNWNMPYTELAALGISATHADIIRKRLSDYRYNLNILINKCQRFCVPKDLSIIANKLSLYGYEFADHETGKAQIIIFNPTYHGIFDETTLSTGGAVRFGTVDIVSRDSESCLVYLGDNDVRFPLLETQLDAMLGSDSVQKIFGDFLAWFGDDQMLRLMPVPDDYVVVPVYSKEILHKIHNMDIIIPAKADGALDFNAELKVGSYVSEYLRPGTGDQTAITNAANQDSFFVYQHDNIIETRFGFFNGTAVEINGYPAGSGNILPYYQVSDARLLDGYTDDWSDEFVCEGVLFKTVLQGRKSGDNLGVYPMTSAFEICLRSIFYTRTSDSNITQMQVNNYSASASDRELKLQTLDWAPIIYRCKSIDWAAPYSDIVEFLALYGDIECCRQLSGQDILRIHRAAAMSAFKTDIVPRT